MCKFGIKFGFIQKLLRFDRGGVSNILRLKIVRCSHQINSEVTEMKQATIYVRARGNEAEQSIQKQIALCEEFAMQHGLNVTRIYKDVSALGEADERPALKALLRDARKGDFDTVLVSSLDRLARNLADMLVYCRKLKRKDSDFVSVTGFDGNPQAITLFEFLQNVFVTGGSK